MSPLKWHLLNLAISHAIVGLTPFSSSAPSFVILSISIRAINLSSHRKSIARLRKAASLSFHCWMKQVLQNSTRQHVTRLPEVSEINSTTTPSSFVSSTESNFQEEPLPDLVESYSQLQEDYFNSPRTSSASVTSTSIPPQRRSSKSYLFFNRLLHFSFITIMNAAITIFGVGIGVGIILADSFRSPSSLTNNSSANSQHATSISRERYHRRSEATVIVSSATPSCRTTIRRAMDRIQEAPPLSLAASSQLPAQ